MLSFFTYFKITVHYVQRICVTSVIDNIRSKALLIQVLKVTKYKIACWNRNISRHTSLLPLITEHKGGHAI